MKGSVTVSETICCIDTATGGSLALTLLKGFLSIIEVILYDWGRATFSAKSSSEVIIQHSVTPNWRAWSARWDPRTAREDRLKKVSPLSLFSFPSLPLLCLLSHRRSGVAMPFGCLTIGEKKDYNNPSDVTDKYDLGQIVKSWVFLQLLEKQDIIYIDIWMKTYLFSRNPHDRCLHPRQCFSSGRSSVRYSGPRTKLQWKCTRVKSSWKRMEGKSARLRKMRSSS